MEPGEAVYEDIVRHFGAAALGADGRLDRAALARIGFAEGRIEELNGIVHPATIAAQAKWMDVVAARDPVAVAIVESALVFETRYTADGVAGEGVVPWRSRFDRIVVVVAGLEVRRERYIQRLGGSATAETGADFDRRCAAQWTDAQREAMADLVLRNEGSIGDLEAAVQGVYGVLKAESMDRAAAAM